ncbi:MAG: hypothetical protein OIN66_09450 [Candidatus Methanoperedens sp.]|nr:hypothetical protein [Candidatus Methanoperedens sp.]
MNKKNPFKSFLSNTSGAVNIPSVAKEGIVSLLISIVANEATSTVSGFSYDNLLRLLIMFLVVLAIIHFSLKITEQLRRKKANLEDLQAANTREALKNLNGARTILDRLVQNSGEVTELRGLRNKLTTIISEIQNPNISKFSKKSATVDEFDEAEKLLAESSKNLALELEKQSKEGADVKAVALLVDAVGDALRNRIPLSNELKDHYVESLKKEIQEKKKIPKETSSELNLYLNTLQIKYASYHPEVLHTGDYAANMKWDYNADDKNITARLSDGLIGSPLLLLETRWQDNGAIIEDVQKEAESVKKNQYKCLCLINSAWDKESKDFVSRFNHPKLSLYLYELNGGLFFNRETPAAKHYEFWFNTEQKRETLKERALRFIEAHEYFTAQEMAGALGMKVEGAEALLEGFEKTGVVTNVSFKSDKIRKYTKAKAKED